MVATEKIEQDPAYRAVISELLAAGWTRTLAGYEVGKGGLMSPDKATAVHLTSIPGEEAGETGSAWLYVNVWDDEEWDARLSLPVESGYQAAVLLRNAGIFPEAKNQAGKCGDPYDCRCPHGCDIP